MGEQIIIIGLVAVAVLLHLIIGFYLIIWPSYKLSKHMKEQTKPRFYKNEWLSFVILPIVGYGTIFLLANEDIAGVFHPNYFMALIVFQIVSFILYFISRRWKHQLGPLFVTIVPSIFMLSIILLAVELIHLSGLFLLSITIGWIMIFLPICMLTYYGMISAIIFLIAETIAVLKQEKPSEERLKHYPTPLRFMYDLFYNRLSGLLKLLLLPIMACIVHVLSRLFYTSNSTPILDAMIECSDGFITGGGSILGGGGSEYLVTIAGHGNEKLVKPIFIGYRNGHRIKVNRQLQICNAFEQLMEEKIPRIHAPLRKGYDAMQIPIEKWKHRRWLANLLFLLFIPLEKVFLLVLYLLEKNPELRISRQYRIN